MQYSGCMAVKSRSAIQVGQDGFNKGLAGIQPFANILARGKSGIPELGTVVVRGAGDFGVCSACFVCHKIVERENSSRRWSPGGHVICLRFMCLKILNVDMICDGCDDVWLF